MDTTPKTSQGVNTKSQRIRPNRRSETLRPAGCQAGLVHHEVEYNRSGRFGTSIYIILHPYWIPYWMVHEKEVKSSACEFPHHKIRPTAVRTAEESGQSSAEALGPWASAWTHRFGHPRKPEQPEQPGVNWAMWPVLGSSVKAKVENSMKKWEKHGETLKARPPVLVNPRTNICLSLEVLNASFHSRINLSYRLEEKCESGTQIQRIPSCDLCSSVLRRET